MKKMLAALLCLAMVIPAAVLGEDEAVFGLTNGAETVLYAQAATTSEATKVYPEGTWSQVTATEGDFYQVTVQDGAQGYIKTEALTLESEYGLRVMLIEDEDGVVNMRVAPSMSARVSRYQKAAGKAVEVLEAGETFSLCDYNGIAQGYIINTRLGEAQTAEVTSQSGARLRVGPGMAYEQLRMVPCGAQVTVLVKGARWCKVAYKDYVGYISVDSLSL